LRIRVSISAIGSVMLMGQFPSYRILVGRVGI
jgi:hypothetical protein